MKYVPVIGNLVRSNFDGEVALVLGPVSVVLVAFHYHTHHIPGCDVLDNEMPLTLHNIVQELGLVNGLIEQCNVSNLDIMVKI